MSLPRIPKAAPGFWPLTGVFAAFAGLYLSVRYLGPDGGDIFFRWLFIAGAFVSASIAIRALLKHPRDMNRASTYAVAAVLYALLASGDVFPRHSTTRAFLRMASLVAAGGFAYIRYRARPTLLERL